MNYVYIIVSMVFLLIYLVTFIGKNYLKNNTDNNKYIKEFNNNTERYEFTIGFINKLSYSIFLILLYTTVYGSISSYNTYILVSLILFISAFITFTTISVRGYIYELCNSKTCYQCSRFTFLIAYILNPIEIVTRRIRNTEKCRVVRNEDKIYNIVEKAESNNIIEDYEMKMIEGVLELDDTLVKEIRVPRPDIESINADTRVSELYNSVQHKNHTRYPVIDDKNSEVVGYIDVKDIVSMSQDMRTNLKAKDIARDIIVVPETTTVSQLLQNFKRNNKQISTIVNEWGTPEGIVTLEDILETIVGDIKDEFDKYKDSPQIKKIDDEKYKLDGSTKVRRFDKLLGTNIAENTNKDTIAGVILEQKKALPDTQDCISMKKVDLKVKEIKNNRIKTVLVETYN